MTERLHEEEERRLNEERLQTIADFTFDWEYWINSTGAILYNSPAFERITGKPVQAFIDNPEMLVAIAHPDDRQIVAQHLREELGGTQIFTLDFRILDNTGQERWISHACQPVRAKDGKTLGRRASNRDITDRKLAEQRLLRTERLAAIGHLVASLAHEINNPLQSMYSSLELAMDFPLELEERKKYLLVVRREIERLRAISENILSYARPRKIGLAPVAIDEVIRYALSLAGEQLKRSNIAVNVDIPSGFPMIVASQDQLAQVFLNLIINSAEHMPDGGRLDICASYTDGAVELSFRDTGSGLSDEAIEHLFEPFFTTKKDGTGLGLANCQRIVEQHGGNLVARNCAQGGAIFIVTLPFRPAAEGQTRRRKR